MFIPRHPVVENQFCSFGAQTAFTGSAGVGGVVCYAGAVLYMDSDSTNQQPIVYRYNKFTGTPPVGKPTEASELIPIGLAMQKVKTGYHQVHPVGAQMPGDMGSSDVIAQPSYDSSGNITGTVAAPLGVAHLGIWDTVYYTCQHTGNTVSSPNHMKPGDNLYPGCNCESRLTNHSTVATDDSLTYEAIVNVVTARVIVGASAAKCSGTIGNTGLFPIRVKLLV